MWVDAEGVQRKRIVEWRPKDIGCLWEGALVNLKDASCGRLRHAHGVSCPQACLFGVLTWVKGTRATTSTLGAGTHQARPSCVLFGTEL